ncbi:MAG: zf-TFIIB domain-containing protein [Candidatus Omnitrophica bacterium]|nr:zf-TFIIB domain-containing protein [Candidatus Omnitrophota bacterium]
MKCPHCKKDLEQIDFRGIVINECPQCRGRWFDRGELQKAKDNMDEDLCWLDFDPFSKKEKHFSMVPEEGGICPKCTENMAMLAYANSGVVIEKCEQCRGVWLKEGEFKKIVAYLENVLTTRSVSEYVADSFKQFVEIMAGPEDRASEARDFLVVLKLLKLRAAIEHSKIAELTNKIYQCLPFL